LQLGNDNIGYENRSLTGDRLELANGEGNGNEKRLLETIVLTNLTNLDKTIDVSGSAKLKEFRALNTSIPKVIFAEGVALDTLHLSKNLTDLELIDAWGLNQVISE
jgi:hypothetical protein